MSLVSRRSLLTSMSAALGLGTAGIVSSSSVASSSSSPRAFTLIGSGLRILGARSKLSVGDTLTLRGSLHESRGAAVSGEFFATATVLAGSSLLEPELGYLQTQLFALSTGTITGTGTVHHDGTGSFTITGGSGRFAGAHGTYRTVQSADHGGSGAAEFTFQLG